MKQKHIHLLSFFLILLIASCCKDEPEPPPPPPEELMLTAATMEGKHTLSFMLDDEVWVSERGLFDISLHRYK